MLLSGMWKAGSGNCSIWKLISVSTPNYFFCSVTAVLHDVWLQEAATALLLNIKLPFLAYLKWKREVLCLFKFSSIEMLLNVNLLLAGLRAIFGTKGQTCLRSWSTWKLFFLSLTPFLWIHRLIFTREAPWMLWPLVLSSTCFDVVDGVIGMAGWILFSQIVQHELPENHITSCSRNPN